MTLRLLAKSIQNPFNFPNSLGISASYTPCSSKK